MTLDHFRQNYDQIRAELLCVKSPLVIKRLFSQLDFTLIQINRLLNAPPGNIR